MADFRERIDELAQLMDEFHLAEARLESDGLTVAFRRRSAAKISSVVVDSGLDADAPDFYPSAQALPAVEEKQVGTPIVSPMTGIFYGASSPGSPPFVKEGDEVSVGQIIGLIEAMKVFNEIPCTMSGTVLKVVAEGGTVVQPGDTIIVLR